MKIRNMAATLLNVTRPIAFAGLLTLMAGSAMAIKPGADLPDCAKMVSNSCSLQLQALCDATDAAISLRDRDRNTLVSKVLGAAVKLTQGKADDADEKLYKYELKLDSLINAPKAKITDGDADAISLVLTPAQTCVDDQL